MGGRSVVCKDVTQEVVILEEEQKFLKLLEILGQFYEKGQTIIFVDKQESADSLFKVRMCEEIYALDIHWVTTPLLFLACYIFERWS